MKSNTQNAKIEAITEKTLVLGIDVGSETHYARAFDYRGIEYSSIFFTFFMFPFLTPVSNLHSPDIIFLLEHSFLVQSLQQVPYQ